MTITPTMTVEMNTGAPISDPAGREILDPYGRNIVDLAWDNIISDVKASEPISIRKGNFGTGPTDRVADIGRMSLGLDNSEYNSVETLGFYSPDHPNRNGAFNVDKRIRLSLSYGGTSKYLFHGRIVEITPESGLYGSRITRIVAEDWMGEASRAPMRGLEVQFGKTADELITLLTGIMSRPPESTDLSVGLDAFAYAFHSELSESTKILTVLQKIAMSGLGRVYVVGNDTTGEILKFITRQDVSSLTIPVATLDNTMVTLRAKRRAYSAIKTLTTVTHPVEVDASATTVLSTLQQEISIPAGGTASFNLRYRDPNNSDTRIAGTAIVTPVADTDFKFSSSSGSGNDLNASLEFVTFVANADQAEMVVKNNAGSTGYLWLFQVRGKGIYLYDPLEYTAESAVLYGNTVTFDMPYQDDYQAGVDVNVALMAQFGQEFTDVPEVMFIANRSEDLMAALLDAEPGDLVAVNETVTGISDTFLLNGYDVTIHKGGTHIDVTWALTPVELYDFFVLDEDYLDVDGPVLAF